MASPTSTNEKQQNTGNLYIIATPIGNLDDITVRAIHILKSVDEILCEDTRHSRKLLTHLGINKSLSSLHNFNEAEKSHAVIAKLKSGLNLALISDAGTPLISDPGFPLVRHACHHNVKVIPIPGPCALVAALSGSSLPTHRFCFEGFLPQKSSTRQKQLETLCQETRTIIFYESPHRLIESLTDMSRSFGNDRPCVIAKELTKTHENFLRGSIQEVIATLEQKPSLQKGEFVIMISGSPNLLSKDENEQQRVLSILLREGLGSRQAATICAKVTGCNKNQAYKLALSLKGKRSS